MDYLESQKYSECQLVTVINAELHLGGPWIDPDSEQYEELVDLVKARHGSALAITEAMYILGLQVKQHAFDFCKMRDILITGNPIGLTVWHIRYGYHSVLATASKNGKVRVHNMSKAFNDPWIGWEELTGLVTEGNGIRFGGVEGSLKNRRQWMWEFSRD